jgi:hypothetical protein
MKEHIALILLSVAKVHLYPGEGQWLGITRHVSGNTPGAFVNDMHK